MLSIQKVKERPILFNTEMVKAVLGGRKTQTRRVVKNESFLAAHIGYDKPRGNFNILCPYGKLGEWLWVRETFYAYGRWLKIWNEEEKCDEWTFEDLTIEKGLTYRYAENPPEIVNKIRKQNIIRWYKRPSIFMPRAAARIFLEITDIRVERVQDITSFNIVQEGVGINGWDTDDVLFSKWIELWDSINEKRGFGWDVNPWVWVVEFKKIETPISEQQQIAEMQQDCYDNCEI